MNYQTVVGIPLKVFFITAGMSVSVLAHMGLCVCVCRLVCVGVQMLVLITA